MAGDLFSRFRSGSGSGSPRPGGTASHIREVEVLAAIDAVPSLPVVVMQILQRVGDQHSNAADLQGLIEQDMVIAGRLLKMVNSPFYGRSQQVTSISQAVQIVGFSSLKSLVVACSASNLFMVDLSCYGFIAGGLWRNSLATAALARAIGQKVVPGGNTAEEWFVSGLMRDVGMLVTGQFLARQGADLSEPGGDEADLLRREREEIGYDHCWVGDRISEKWALPAGLRTCIARHHRIPPDAAPALLRQLAALRLAERLAYNAGAGLGTRHPFETAVDAVLVQAAGLDAMRFQDLIKQVPELLRGIEHMA